MKSETIEKVSGSVAGAVFILSCYPLDMRKTIYQTGEVPNLIITRSNPLTLFKGALFPTLFGAAGGFVFYSSMENSRRFVARLKGKTNLNFSDSLLAGGITGFVYGLYSSFAESVKVSMQVNRGEFTNSLQFFKFKVREKGLAWFFRGLAPTVIVEVVASSVFLATYYHLCEFYFRKGGIDDFIAGGLSGMAAWNAMILFDTMKSQVLSKNELLSLKNQIEILREISRNQLMKSYFPGLLRSALANSTSMWSYQLLSTYLLKYHLKK